MIRRSGFDTVTFIAYIAGEANQTVGCVLVLGWSWIQLPQFGVKGLWFRV